MGFRKSPQVKPRRIRDGNAFFGRIKAFAVFPPFLIFVDGRGRRLRSLSFVFDAFFIVLPAKTLLCSEKCVHDTLLRTKKCIAATLFGR